jgi:hypothetical protein
MQAFHISENSEIKGQCKYVVILYSETFKPYIVICTMCHLMVTSMSSDISFDPEGNKIFSFIIFVHY